MKRKIFLTGDTHGSVKRFSSRNWPEGKDLTKDDVVIQLGDFGLLFDSKPGRLSTYDAYWLEWLALKPWTTIVVLGNHEQYDYIMGLPETEIFGAKAWVWSMKDPKNSIFFIKAGEIMTINDETFMCIRGADSIDKTSRTEGISWWPQELLSKEEENHVLDKLDEVNWKVDWLLTHTTADSVIYAFLDNPDSPKFLDPVAKFLEFISNRLEFKGNIFGHFHNERTYTDPSGDYYRCLFESIVDLDDIKEDVL